MIVQCARDNRRSGAALSAPGSSRGQIYAWKKQLIDHAARVFDPKVGKDAEAASAREMEKLHAKIGQLTIENDFFVKRFGG